MTSFDHSLSALVAVALALTACGYQFRVEGAGPTIGGKSAAEAQAQANAPTLSVVNFDNRSFEPNLEVKYTQYTRHEFAAASGTRVVYGSEPSDLTFKGQIIAVIIPSLTFSIDQTLESRVTVMVGASVEENRTKTVIWSQLATASSEFFVTNDLQFNRVLQDRALEQAGQFIVQDLAARFQNHLDQYGIAAAKGSVTAPIVPTGELGGGRR